ncbi:MAG: hypothetical protein K2N24_04045, partial [Lachnospiraceae bacterium]|nr:hypothetical protein [Lachnospiraceae bacterium]
TYVEVYNYIYGLSEKNQVIIVDNTPPQTDMQKKEYVFRRVEKHNEKLKGFIDESKNEMQA